MHVKLRTKNKYCNSLVKKTLNCRDVRYTENIGIEPKEVYIRNIASHIHFKEDKETVNIFVKKADSLVQKWKKVSSIVILHSFYRRRSKIWLYCFRCSHNELQYLFIPPDVTKRHSSPEEIYILHNYL